MERKGQLVWISKQNYYLTQQGAMPLSAKANLSLIKLNNLISEMKHCDNIISGEYFT